MLFNSFYFRNIPFIPETRVHVFDKESRLFYDIERIWRDGKIMEAGEFAEHAGVV